MSDIYGREFWSVTGMFVLGLVIGGAAIWYFAPEGPNSGNKSLSDVCLTALDADYEDLASHMFEVAPPLTRRVDGSESAYVATADGEDSEIVHVDYDAIEATWQPELDDLIAEHRDKILACLGGFPAYENWVEGERTLESAHGSI